MRKEFLAVALVLGLLPAAVYSQKIVENPEKPIGKNAGRVLGLQEIWRITDEEGKFYFKRPADLRVAPDGSIFVVDEAELLKFSPHGEFVRNVFKPGQGPGELTSEVPALTIREKELVLYDFMARNMIFLSSEGNLIRQFRIETGPYSRFYGIFGDRFVFHQELFPPSAERKPGRQNISPCSVYGVSARPSS